MDFQIPELRYCDDYSDQPVHPEHAEHDAETWYDQEGRACAYGYSANNYLWMHWPGLVTYQFDSVSNYVTAHPTIQDRDYLVEDTYYRSVLPFVLQIRGWQVLHASGVAGNFGVAAFCGESGVGKSTLLYGLIQRGYQSWADDAVAFQSDPLHSPSIRLPFQVRLLSNSIQYFNLETAQQRLLSQNALPVLSIQPLAAVFILTRSPEYNEYSQGDLIHRLRPDQAFTALLEHAYCFMPENAEIRQKMISGYLNLVGTIPVYRVTAPEGLIYFPNLLDAIENTLNSR